MRRGFWGRSGREAFTLRTPGGEKFRGVVAPEDIMLTKDLGTPAQTANGPSVVSPAGIFHVNLQNVEREAIDLILTIEDVDGNDFQPVDIHVNQAPVNGIAHGRVVSSAGDNRNMGIRYAGMAEFDDLEGYIFEIIRANGGSQTRSIDSFSFDSTDANPDNHFMNITLNEATSTPIAVNNYFGIAIAQADRIVPSSLLTAGSVPGRELGTVANNVAPTATSVEVSFGVEFDGQFAGKLIQFLTGARRHVPQLITGSSATTDQVTFVPLPGIDVPLPGAPAVGDELGIW